MTAAAALIARMVRARRAISRVRMWREVLVVLVLVLEGMVMGGSWEWGCRDEVGWRWWEEVGEPAPEPEREFDVEARLEEEEEEETMGGWICVAEAEMCAAEWPIVSDLGRLNVGVG
jgi:hypothetical protein